MAIIQRILGVNRIQLPATVLTASASPIGSPVLRLKDQLRSKSWRSPVGWVITTSNRGIDFFRGVAQLALVATGTYATGAALAAAIVAALEAQDPTPAWTCSYDVGTNKFTIGSDLAFTLLFGSGANWVVSIGSDLGFANVDTGSATSHTAGSISYQSRHAITADLGAAAEVTAAIVINHNSGSGGTYTFQADVASLAAVGYNDTVTPDFGQVLSGNASIRIAYFANPNRRYLRLLVNDVQNPLGYSEVGIWYAGPFVETVRAFGPEYGKTPETLNEITNALSGAHFVDVRAEQPIWDAVGWRGLSESERDAVMAAFEALPTGMNFFFSFDIADPTKTEYVFLKKPASYRNIEGALYVVDAPQLTRALG